MRLLLMAVPLFIGAAVHAHRPSFPTGAAGTPEAAVRVRDVDLSQVWYYEATEEAPRLWLTFDGRRDQEVFVQIGVPVIERYRSLRPSVALLGPGLPAAELPFGVPEELGGRVVSTEDVQEPRFFYERFTGTDSWIVHETTLELAADGKHYVVAYLPPDVVGKLWVSLGTREEFGPGDMTKMNEWTRKVRAFHEVEGRSSFQKKAGTALAALVAGLAWLAGKLFGEW